MKRFLRTWLSLFVIVSIIVGGGLLFAGAMLIPTWLLPLPYGVIVGVGCVILVFITILALTIHFEDP